MLASIDFNDEPPIPAHEVRILRPNRLLTGKLEPAELPIAKVAPKLRRCRRGRSRNDLAVLTQCRSLPRMPLTLALSPQAGRGGLFSHLVLCHVLEDADEAGMVPGLAAERGRAIEELLGRGRVRQ
jgi:hypothetical protein